MNTPHTTSALHELTDPLGSMVVSWQIDADDEAVSPAEAAYQTWMQFFACGRTHQPTSEDACVFDVTSGDRSWTVDLSEERFAELFDQE